MADNFNEKEEMNEEDDNIIILLDENNIEREFEHIANVEYNNQLYIVLEPVELFDGMEDGDVVIYKLNISDGDKDEFIPIEDEKELQAVFDEFMKLVEESESCDCGCEDCDGHCDCGADN